MHESVYVRRIPSSAFRLSAITRPEDSPLFSTGDDEVSYIVCFNIKAMLHFCSVSLRYITKESFKTYTKQVPHIVFAVFLIIFRHHR